jgi:hypothetical protein
VGQDGFHGATSAKGVRMEDLLYRVNMRCNQEWGAAIERLKGEGVWPGFALEPFEAIAWHNAVYIVDALYTGKPIATSLLGGLR